MSDNIFKMFSLEHIGAILALLVSLFLIKRLSQPNRLMEHLFALSLLVMEALYHVWMLRTGRWNLSYSLPLELCSISLILTILLLWTGNRRLYEFVFYVGIGGALQAILTPDLDMGFPHFRFFHFFYTHIGIIMTACYFTWIKGYTPTFKGIIKTMVALNILLPFIFIINIIFQGNYMFLIEKPVGGSLLDYLGPYPWYLLSLEVVAFLIFLILWLIFRRRGEAMSGIMTD